MLKPALVLMVLLAGCSTPGIHHTLSWTSHADVDVFLAAGASQGGGPCPDDFEHLDLDHWSGEDLAIVHYTDAEIVGHAYKRPVIIGPSSEYFRIDRTSGDAESTRPVAMAMLQALTPLTAAERESTWQEMLQPEHHSGTAAQQGSNQVPVQTIGLDRNPGWDWVDWFDGREWSHDGETLLSGPWSVTPAYHTCRSSLPGGPDGNWLDVQFNELGDITLSLYAEREHPLTEREVRDFADGALAPLGIVVPAHAEFH